MISFFKKIRKKKEYVKMDEQKTEFSNQEINNDIISEILEEITAKYATLKDAITYEFSDYENRLKREKNQATIYKNKVQARDVMEKILPVLSDMRNDIIDSTDLNDLKSLLQSRYKQLFCALRTIGIDVQVHERNEFIAENEMVTGYKKTTTDPNLHQKVACSNKMGCIIRGEEDNPILEDVEIFDFKRGTSSNPYDNSDDYTSIPERKSALKNSSEQAALYQCNDNGIHRDIIKEQDQLEKMNSNAWLYQERYVQFQTPISLIKQQLPKGVILISPSEAIEVNQWKNLTIPLDYKNQKSCNINLGNLSLLKEFSLENIELFYYVAYDAKNKSLFLKLKSKNTKYNKEELLVDQRLTFIIK